MNIRTRWLIRRDLPAVLAIERASFVVPWSEDDFLCYLRRRNCIGLVAEYRSKIRGFLVYERHAEWLRLVNLAIDPASRRQGVGRQLIEHLKGKLSQRRREAILYIRESNLEAQLFLRACGFRGTGIIADHYEDPCEDAYILRYNTQWAKANAFIPENRIARYFGSEV